MQGGRGGSNESERFGDEPSAEAFEKLGDAHSQQRPYGWVKGQGFVEQETIRPSPATSRSRRGPRATNHVHLRVNFPPKVAVSRLVNSLKGVSSRRLRQEFPDLVRHYWRAQACGPSPTSPGPVGGAPLSTVKQYIEQQSRPPRR